MPRIVAAGLVVTMVASRAGIRRSTRCRTMPPRIVAQLPRQRSGSDASLRRDGNSPGAIEQVQSARRRNFRRRRTRPTGTEPGAERRDAGADRRTGDQRPAVHHLGFRQPDRVRRTGDARLLLRVLPARVWRSLQAEARENRRALAGEEEDHRPDPRRDQSSDRPVPLRSHRHEHRRRRGDVDRVLDDRAGAGGALGRRGRRLQHRFPTSGRSSWRSPRQSSRSFSSAPWRWRRTWPESRS